MDYRTLGRTGVRISPLCLGTMNFGSRTGEDEAIAMIRQALDAGINFIDTANRYGDAGEGAGRAEEMIGRALRESGLRDRAVLATKVHFHMTPDDPNAGGLSRRHIVTEVENSLRRLQTDAIDLYQLQRPMPEIPLDETLRALDDLVHAGKVRYLGTSTFPAWMIVEGLWVSDRLGLHRFVSEQLAYSMVFRLGEREVLPVAQRHNLALLAFSPLWGGFLTGKYWKDRALPPGSRFTFDRWQGLWDTGLTDRAFNLLYLLEGMSAEKGCTISQLALAWTMRQPGITSVIMGPRTPGQLEDNLGALDVIVTDEDCARIEEIARPRGALVNP
jgi:aryl-alcohol dehydrogenase-like predicted oxidoreductase